MSSKLYLEGPVAQRATISCKGGLYDVMEATIVVQTLS